MCILHRTEKYPSLENKMTSLLISVLSHDLHTFFENVIISTPFHDVNAGPLIIFQKVSHVKNLWAFGSFNYLSSRLKSRTGNKLYFSPI